MLFASSILYLKQAFSFGDSGSPHMLRHPPSFGDSGHHSASLYILITPPFGDSGAPYISDTPLHLAILNTPPHLALSVHRITLPHLALSVS